MLGIGVGDAQSRSKNVQLMLESNMMQACCYLLDSTGLHFNTTLFPITMYMSTIQKSRKCHELPRKSIKKLTPTPREGVGGSFRGQNFKSWGNSMNCRENWFILLPLTPTHPGGGVLWDTISASSFEKYIRNVIILSDYIANIPGEAR